MLRWLRSLFTHDARICIQCGARYDQHDLRYFRDCVLK
jgi:hypothetical protein